MTLANEAAYIYQLSKDLRSLNKKLHKAREKSATVSHRPEKNAAAKKKLEKLLRKHNEVLQRLRHHHVAFTHALQKEHKE